MSYSERRNPKEERMTRNERDQHGTLRMVAASPSWMAIRATLQRDEGSGDVTTGVMTLRQCLVVLVKGTNFEDLGVVNTL
jgi:hypothetical protein